MIDFNDYKIIKGINNVAPYEDQIEGSNGTAIVLRINNFIDAVEESINNFDINPGLNIEELTNLFESRGHLLTKDNRNNLTSIPLGFNNSCLIADYSIEGGLRYEERVDLHSPQIIAGNKTFISPVTINESLTISNNLTVAGSFTCENILLSNLSLPDDLIVEGGIFVTNNSLFESNIQVAGTLSTNNFTSAGLTNLSITSIIGTLNVFDNTSLDKNLVVGEDLIVAGDVEIGGIVNIEANAIINSLTVTNSITALGGLSSPNIYTKSEIDTFLSVIEGGNQAISADLNALASFSNTSLGFVTRTAPGAFSTRTFTTSAPLSFSNANGINGNTLLSISSASNSTPGVVQYTTNTEIIAGQVDNRVVSPLTLVSRFASPPGIGTTTANSGKFTLLETSGNTTINGYTEFNNFVTLNYDANLSVFSTAIFDNSVQFNEDVTFLTTSEFKENLIARKHLIVKGNASFGAGISYKRLPVETDYTITLNDYLIASISTTSSKIITLPLTSSVPIGTVYIITDESGNAATFNTTIKTQLNTSSNQLELINNSSTTLLNSNFASITLYNSGTRWIIIK